jgi:transposase
MERRRMRAGRWFEEGRTQAWVVQRLGVSRQSVSRWAEVWQEEGIQGLRAAGRAGRKSRLSERQRRQVVEALVAGPEKFGYSTGLWTLPRVARLIRDLTGVSYHPGHVWHLLGSLGWSCQRPTGRAIERDERAIRRWKKRRWPEVKKKPVGKAEPSSL